jgi:ferredoxin
VTSGAHLSFFDVEGSAGCAEPRKNPLRQARFFLRSTSLLAGEPMADAANKYPENVEGKFYVDDQCIDCDLCRETAPANYKRNDDGGHSFVYKQPETPEEEALCKEAMEGCPVEAIGSDGG